MVDVRGDVLRPPHGTTPAAVKSNIKSEMRSFKSNENIHKKEGGSYYVVSANKAQFDVAVRMSIKKKQYGVIQHGGVKDGPNVNVTHWITCFVY